MHGVPPHRPRPLRLSRRQLLAGIAASWALPWSWTAGADDRPELSFRAARKSRTDDLTLPRLAGYRRQVLLAWGTPICGGYPAFRADGRNTAVEQAQQMGMHHDGLQFFARPSYGDGFERGVLAVNHPSVDRRLLHTDDSGERRLREAVDKEMAAVGISLVEIARDERGGDWSIVEGSRYNRRITATSPMHLFGPLRGHPAMQTRHSPEGTRTRGTLGNAAATATPWNSYLSGEKDFHVYFRSDDPSRPEHRGYGIHGSSDQAAGFRWHTVEGDAYARFDASPTGSEPKWDYGNEAVGFGWMVELDPHRPDLAPRKRTALGRFAHAGAAFSQPQAGQRLALYMSDGAENECFYKFVTRSLLTRQTANGSLLDDGTLYAARFDARGRGRWLALDQSNPAIRAAGYLTLAEILIDARGAARAAGASLLDEPAGTAVSPLTGEVYLSLRGSRSRGGAEAPVDPANPRAPNPYGHVLRLRENGGRAEALEFAWDIALFGAPADDARQNRSGLNEDCDFIAPGDLQVDARGVLWIQTASGEREAMERLGSNNQMLAAAPAERGLFDLRRFLVGPRGAALAGLCFTADASAMFFCVQHPGETEAGAWPDGPPPRSAVVAIRHRSGKPVGS